MFLAPSRINSAAMQQEFHSYFVSESVSRHKARIWNVLSARCHLLWVDFQAVSVNGTLIRASFSNWHENV